MDRVLGFFRALADAGRLRIVGPLAERERSVGELATLVGLKSPTVSHQLAKLREAGLVRMRSEGTGHVYALDSERLQRLRRDVLRAGRVTALTDDVEGTAWERKVRRDFFDGERLEGIPTSAGKRTVISRWFAAQFALGTHYRERQVDDLLQQHYADSNTSRPLLVDAHLLHRLVLRQRLLGRRKTSRWGDSGGDGRLGRLSVG